MARARLADGEPLRDPNNDSSLEAGSSLSHSQQGGWASGRAGAVVDWTGGRAESSMRRRGEGGGGS